MGIFSSLIRAIKDTELYFYLFEMNRDEVRVEGACKMTGRCCQALMLGYGLRPIRTRKEFEKAKKARPFYEMFIPLEEQFDDGYLRFTCKNLTEDHKCGIHEPRPDMCRRYPDPLMVRYGGKLLPGCGYKLVPKTGFDEILEEKLVNIKKK